MKRFGKSILWIVLATAFGWIAMSVGLRRNVSAVWKDLPVSGRAPYLPAERAQTENRLQQIGKAHDVAGLADWLNEIATETSVDRLRAAVDAAKSLPGGWNVFATRVVLERLADVDPAAALDFTLLRLGNGTAGWNALANLVRLRAGSDPGQVRQFLTAASIQLCRGAGGVAELGRLRASECLDAIARFHLPLDDAGVKECLAGAGEVEPARVLALFPDAHVSEVGPAMNRWLESDPKAVLAWMDTQKHVSAYLRWEAMARIALKTGEFESLAKLPPEGRGLVLNAMAWRNPELAVKALQSLPPADLGELSGRLIPGMISPATAGNVLAWLESVPPELRGARTMNVNSPIPMADLPRWLALGLSSDMLNSQTAMIFGFDPAGGMEWMESLTPQAQVGALPGMAQGLAEVEPEKAAAFLATQPRGQRWSEAVNALARNWGAYDADGAKRWIDTLPPVAAREALKEAGWAR